MKVLILVSLLSFVGLVLCQGLSDDEKKAILEKAEQTEEAEKNKQTRHYGNWNNYYYFTDRTGQCCNTGVQGCTWRSRRFSVNGGSWYFRRFFSRYNYPGLFYYSPPRRPSCILACKCDHMCVAPTPTPAPTTAAPTTAAPTTAAPTTAAPTTAAPTTAAPTTAAPTTAAPTTAAPTTAAPTTRFCPAEATTKETTRILNGAGITDCGQVPGLVAIVANGNTMCTGVVTTATTLSIPESCAFILTGIGSPISVTGFDGTTIESNLQVSASGVGGPVTVTLATPVPTTSCPGIACVYSATMANNIMLDTCKLAGAGYSSNTDISNGPKFETLAIPSLLPTSTCAGLLSSSAQAAFFDLADTSITYNCFVSPSGSACQGDFGAPVVCDLTTGEQVVIGQVENGECTVGSVLGLYNLETASVRVLPTDKGQIQLG